MDDTIQDYLVKNKNKFKLELLDLKQDLKSKLATEDPVFHELVKQHFSERVRGYIIRDLSLNLGVDFETGMIQIEEVNMLEYLK